MGEPNPSALWDALQLLGAIWPWLLAALVVGAIGGVYLGCLIKD